MNKNFASVISATEKERLDLFLATAACMGTAGKLHAAADGCHA